MNRTTSPQSPILAGYAKPKDFSLRAAWRKTIGRHQPPGVLRRKRRALHGSTPNRSTKVRNPALPGVDDAKTPATETKPTTLPSDKTGDASNESADGPGRLWECSVCGFVYSERLGLPDEGIPPGTAWEDIPEDWKCPDCGTSKAEFQMVEVLRVANATVF